MNAPNYPYLSGYLQSAMKNLAYDKKFVKLKEDERYDYIIKLIAEANKSAIEYENGN